MIRRVTVLLLALVATACTGDAKGAAPATTVPIMPTSTSTSSTTTSPPARSTTEDYESDVYDRRSAWLCRPDTEDACEADLDATVVRPDGNNVARPFQPAADPPVDCFYVYPTVSLDDGLNSDMEAQREERNVIRQQAGRFGAVCSVYSPIYRQLTRTELDRWFPGSTRSPSAAQQRAYDDVLDAWRHYVANDNDGRGVILIGHSQGAMHLTRLLREEIEPDESQRELLVSAMLLGASVHAGDLDSQPCAEIHDTGCVISYSTYSSSNPPTADSHFGRTNPDDEPALCTNPAALAGTRGELEPYFSGGEWASSITTPFVTMSAGVVVGECVERDGISYLELTVQGDRTLPGVDQVLDAGLPRWGTHAIDVNVALGDLVRAARAQAATYAAR